jgi:hypothetical protein
VDTRVMAMPDGVGETGVPDPRNARNRRLVGT